MKGLSVERRPLQVFTNKEEHRGAQSPCRTHFTSSLFTLSIPEIPQTLVWLFSGQTHSFINAILQPQSPKMWQGEVDKGPQAASLIDKRCSTITQRRKWSRYVPQSCHLPGLAGFSMAQKPSGEGEQFSVNSEISLLSITCFPVFWDAAQSLRSLHWPLFQPLHPEVILPALNTCKWHFKEIKQSGSLGTCSVHTHSPDFLLMEVITRL